MTPNVRPLVAGNWKMNGLRSSLGEIKAIADASEDLAPSMDILICPPATLLYVSTALVDGTRLRIGAQDCHVAQSGAHTGDISAGMIADCLGTHVILGHSERRADHWETNEIVCMKAGSAHEAGLITVICVGETQDERDTGKTLQVVGEQLARSVPDSTTSTNTAIAYEPVWAIGTGQTPTPQDVAEVHAFMRKKLNERLGDAASTMPLLYGGSVKPGNAEELMAVENVDGALVGGASLKSADFLAICAACKASSE